MAKKMGGTGIDIANCIRQTSDGGYIVAGESSSNDGDVSFNYGQTDYWIVKLSSSGTIQWQKSYGGSNFDKAYSIAQTTDGGYIIAGETDSNDGNVSGLHGLQDFWIIKVSSTGILEWQKALGGNLGDVAYSIQQTLDGNYIVAGVSESPNGDVVGLHGDVRDFWVVKLNSTGNILWQKCLGGTNDEYAYSIQQTTDSGFIIAGQSNSIDGDATTNQGGYDFWVVKLAPDLLSTNNFKQDNLVLYPNPSNSLLNIEIPNSFTVEKILIIDGNSKIIKEQNNTSQISIESLSSGIYLIQAYSGTNKFQNKFVKQ